MLQVALRESKPRETGERERTPEQRPAQPRPMLSPACCRLLAAPVRVVPCAHHLAGGQPELPRATPNRHKTCLRFGAIGFNWCLVAGRPTYVSNCFASFLYLPSPFLCTGSRQVRKCAPPVCLDWRENANARVASFVAAKTLSVLSVACLLAVRSLAAGFGARAPPRATTAAYFSDIQPARDPREPQCGNVSFFRAARVDP